MEVLELTYVAPPSVRVVGGYEADSPFPKMLPGESFADFFWRAEVGEENEVWANLLGAKTSIRASSLPLEGG